MLNPRYVAEAKKDGSIMDLIMVNNEYSADIIKKYFWYDGEILKIGLPRNDIIGNPSNEIIEKVYNYFGIDKSKKIIIYAPTFRANEGLDVYKFDYDKVIEQISKTFNDEFVMILRLHPNVSKYAEELQY